MKAKKQQFSPAIRSIFKALSQLLNKDWEVEMAWVDRIRFRLPGRSERFCIITAIYYDRCHKFIEVSWAERVAAKLGLSIREANMIMRATDRPAGQLSVKQRKLREEVESICKTSLKAAA